MWTYRDPGNREGHANAMGMRKDALSQPILIKPEVGRSQCLREGTRTNLRLASSSSVLLLHLSDTSPKDVLFCTWSSSSKRVLFIRPNDIVRLKPLQHSADDLPLF